MDEIKDGQSAESAYPVRVLNQKIATWIGKLGRVWVEGQIIKISNYGRNSYIEFRDLETDNSISVVT
ncbi:MAG: hypothetical protein RL038_938, partial [Actinomycetota bacterium]